MLQSRNTRPFQGELFPETAVGWQVLVHLPAELRLSDEAVEAALLIGPLKLKDYADGVISFGALLACGTGSRLRWVEVDFATLSQVSGFEVRIRDTTRSIVTWQQEFQASSAFDLAYGVDTFAPSVTEQHRQAVQRLNEHFSLAFDCFSELLPLASRVRADALRRLIEIALAPGARHIRTPQISWVEAALDIFEIPAVADGPVGDRALEISRSPIAASMTCRGRGRPSHALRAYAYGRVSARELSAVLRKEFGPPNTAALLRGAMPPRKAWHLPVRTIERALRQVRLSTGKEAGQGLLSSQLQSIANDVGTLHQQLGMPVGMAVSVLRQAQQARKHRKAPAVWVLEVSTMLDNAIPEASRLEQLRWWRETYLHVKCPERTLLEHDPMLRWEAAAQVEGLLPAELADELLSFLPQVRIEGRGFRVTLARTLEDIGTVGSALANCLYEDATKAIYYLCTGRLVAAVVEPRQGRIAAALTLDLRNGRSPGHPYRPLVSEPLGIGNWPMPGSEGLRDALGAQVIELLGNPAIQAYKKRWRQLMRGLDVPADFDDPTPKDGRDA